MKTGYNCFYVHLQCLTWSKDMLTSRREMRQRGGGGGWSLEQTCVWEPSVIHTLLIPKQLRAIKSLRRFSKRGLCLESSECLWEFKKDLLWSKCTLHLFPPDWSRVHHLFILVFHWLQTPFWKKSKIYLLFQQETSITRKSCGLTNELRTLCFLPEGAPCVQVARCYNYLSAQTGTTGHDITLEGWQVK